MNGLGVLAMFPNIFPLSRLLIALSNYFLFLYCALRNATHPKGNNMIHIYVCMYLLSDAEVSDVIVDGPACVKQFENKKRQQPCIRLCWQYNQNV